MKNKLDEDFYQSKPNKHLWLLGSVVNKQMFPDTCKPESKSASIQANGSEV